MLAIVTESGDGDGGEVWTTMTDARSRPTVDPSVIGRRGVGRDGRRTEPSGGSHA